MTERREKALHAPPCSMSFSVVTRARLALSTSPDMAYHALATKKRTFSGRVRGEVSVAGASPRDGPSWV